MTADKVGVGAARGGLSTREQVWVTAWTAVARAETCRSKEIAAGWADACLAAFDERFTARLVPDGGDDHAQGGAG